MYFVHCGFHVGNNTLPGAVVSTDITNGSITDSSVLKAQVPSAVVGNVVSTIYFGGIQSLDWTGLERWTGATEHTHTHTHGVRVTYIVVAKWAHNTSAVFVHTVFE